MATVIFLSVILISFTVVNCQDFIFKTIDSHEDRITALESNRNVCVNCCDCRDVEKKYKELKVEMGQIINIVNELKLEMKHLRESNTHSSNLQSSPPPLSSQTAMFSSRESQNTITVPLMVTSDNSLAGKTTARTTDATKNIQQLINSSPTAIIKLSSTSRPNHSPHTSKTVPSSTQPLTIHTPAEMQTTMVHKSFPPTETSSSTSTKSHLSHSTTSSTSSAIQRDCGDVLRNGHKKNGVYTLTLLNGKRLDAFCDFQDDGGWTVVQRRMDGSQDFNQNWKQYKNGFGNNLREFWIGNDNLHILTNGKDMTLHIQLMTWDGTNHTAIYNKFHVGSEQDIYKLTVGRYLGGDAGDSLNYPSSYMLAHNKMAFSTPDRDNDISFQHCGSLLQSGWWFSSCYSSNLNGRYLMSGPYGRRRFGESFGQPTMEGTGVEWYPLKRKQYSMKFVEMKIRST